MNLLFLSLLLYCASPEPSGFKASQMTFSRVREAFRSKETMIDALLAERKINLAQLEIFIRVFKQEKMLQVWAANKGQPFVHLKSYAICESSGTLGPKRRVGDFQVPEGFYVISRFNPSSNYYLSLGISYPNRSDHILSPYSDLGGDIFIHGNCVTIGCIPITDDLIRELYVLAVKARDAGQKNISVHIFPTAMTEEGYRILVEKFKPDAKLKAFWENLKTGYGVFERQHLVPEISVGVGGEYIFN